MKRFGDDSGMAMVTAIMAGMVVLTLSTAAFSLGAHNLDQSANDRRSVQAIHAAEAGVDRFVRYLETATVCDPETSLSNEDLTTDPASSFVVSASYFASTTSPDPWTACGDPSTPPGAVLIRSVGTSASVSRAMEGYYQITPRETAGSPFGDAALYSHGDSEWTGHGSILSPSYDADLYTDGVMKLTGGGQIQGSTYAQETTTLSSGTDVKGSVMSKGSLTVNGGAVIRGDGQSTEGGVAVSGTGSKIFGNAWYCTGNATPQSGVGGTITNRCPPNSPIVPQEEASDLFPFRYDSNTNPAYWNTYTITNFTNCDLANAFITTGITTGNHVVRINSTCTLDLKVPITLKGNLAVLSDGYLSNQTSFASLVDGYTLHLVFGLGSSFPGCSSNGIAFNQGSTSANMTVLLYTPCRIKVGGGSTLSGAGQILSGDLLQISSGSSFTYAPVTIPGVTGIGTGFDSLMAYRREIAD
jgi:hypothetical protein